MSDDTSPRVPAEERKGKRYRKADFTPEEWAERCRKDRDRARRRAAARSPDERMQRNAYFSAAHRRHYAALKEDADGREHLRTNARAKRQRRKQDPDRHRLYLERKRTAYHRRRNLEKLFRPGKPVAPVAADALSWMRAKAFAIPAFDQIIKAMPAKWSLDFKEEIAAEAMILLLDRTASTVAEAVKLGIKAHNRLYDRFKTVSIDAENADGFRIIDTIASDHMENFL